MTSLNAAAMAGPATPFDGPDLPLTPANFAPLTPLSLIRRTAQVFPNRTAIISGSVRRSWAETEARCRRLASALAKRGVGRGDVVSVLAPNTPEAVEGHFGPPMAGAILNAINVRLDSATVAFILDHAETKLLIVDQEFAPLATAALDAMSGPKPLVVEARDPDAPETALSVGAMDYETLLAEGDPSFEPVEVDDEWRAITLNYTSGTTGEPKGVVYSHRGAYLLALGNVVTWGMGQFPVYLWTLPMFHCNGWCFPWTLAALAGTNVCLRRVEREAIYGQIDGHGVTHLCGAPIVMAMMASGAEDGVRTEPFDPPIKMMTAAAPPPAPVIARMEALGVDICHVYGLTEVYGPAVVCSWNPDWDALPLEERARIKSRQGVPYEVQEDLMVADPATMTPVPRDGETLGEIFMRGNIVMKGYFKRPEATRESFSGGWFHTGDLAVVHPDGYVEIKDRSKDIIISGGENISSIEVENALYKHPAVDLVAVVAQPDETWGESPCAFVELKPGETATEADLLAVCREHLAGYKRPKRILFEPLPKTSTGKIRKHELRAKAKTLD